MGDIVYLPNKRATVAVVHVFIEPPPSKTIAVYAKDNKSVDLLIYAKDLTQAARALMEYDTGKATNVINRYRE